jgi:hypothetical protein
MRLTTMAERQGVDAMYSFDVTFVARYSGPCEEARKAAERATGVGLEVTWVGAQDNQLAFTDRPREPLAWPAMVRVVGILQQDQFSVSPGPAVVGRVDR